MDLTSPEQIIYSPIVSDEANAMTVNTFIPGRDQTISCEVTPPSGFTYAIDPTSGQGKHGFWTGKLSDAGSRLPLAATGSPSLITVNGKLVMLTKDSKGDVIVTPVYIPGEGKIVRRLSWRKLF